VKALVTQTCHETDQVSASADACLAQVLSSRIRDGGGAIPWRDSKVVDRCTDLRGQSQCSLDQVLQAERNSIVA
jgi:hypothetical protein